MLIRLLPIVRSYRLALRTRVCRAGAFTFDRRGRRLFAEINRSSPAYLLDSLAVALAFDLDDVAKREYATKAEDAGFGSRR